MIDNVLYLLYNKDRQVIHIYLTAMNRRGNMNTNGDDFLTKTTEVFNGLFDSIDKSIKNLQKETGTKPHSFGQNIFKKSNYNEQGGRTVAPEGKAMSIPASRVDIGESIKILCELPGCEKQNLKLDYDKDTLIVRAKKPAPVISDEATFHEDDRKYGTLERRFRIGKVDPSTIRAGYKDGVLTICCARTYESGGIGIDIE